ncbi:MAG: acyltransferase [Peptostreptococcaceae bacterium]|nr:acyltransferase [Peptostreptococcaceae bacterium]
MQPNKIIDLEQARHTIRRKKPLGEISIMRVFSMFAVIAIHFLNIPVSQVLVGSKGHGNFFMLRSMLVFAVPSFLFVSMMMLTYGLDGKKLDVLDLYKKKFVRIAIPYLLWSAAYQFILILTGNVEPAKILNPKSISYLLLYGKSYEHLYFMIILLELFLVAPILIPIARKVKDSWTSAIAIAFGTQMVIYVLNRFYIRDHFTMIQSTFLWYFSIAFIGLWFGCNYERNLKTVQRHQNKLFIALALSGIIYSYYSRLLWQQMWNEVVFDTFFYTLDLHLYMLLCTLGSLLIAKWVVSYPIDPMGRKKRSYRFFMWLSPLTYGIYLMHPGLTYLVRKLIESRSSFLWTLVVACGVPLTAALCGKITEWMQDIPVLSLAFGNGLIPKKKKA